MTTPSTATTKDVPAPAKKPTPVQTKQAHEALLKARIALLQQFPFFGALALNLTLIESCEVPTAATDIRGRLRYNPFFVLEVAKDPEQLLFLICHEIMHVCEQHMLRCGPRNPLIFNVASDHCINLILLECGVKPTAGAMMDKKYTGMTAEAVYVQIMEEVEQQEDGKGKCQHGANQPHDGECPGGKKGEKARPGFGQCGSCAHGKDPSNGDADGKPEEGEGEGGEGVDPNQWPVHVAAAAQLAKQRGKLPAALERYIEERLNPKVDWRKVLQRLLRRSVAARSGRDDFSYARPSRRGHVLGDAWGGHPPILASTVAHEPGEILIAIDTSGSIGGPELQTFASEAMAICEQIGRPSRVVFCDAEIASEVKAATDYKKLIKKAKGGGGTDFRPVFKYAEDMKPRPCCIVYFTDLMGGMPSKEIPGVKTIWCATMDGEVPFGKVIRIDINELKKK